MEHLIHLLEPNLHELVHLCAVAVECVGVFILMWNVIRAFTLWVAKIKNHHISLELGEGIALALEFLMVAEILHTVITDSITQLIVLAAILAFRVILTVVIHWEINGEKKEIEEHEHHHE